MFDRWAGSYLESLIVGIVAKLLMPGRSEVS
jgi:hypothetical protein